MTPPLTGSGGERSGARTRPIARLAVLCVSSAALLLVPSSPSALAAVCSNEAIRTEQGPAALALPDCRAYELVSPGRPVSVTSVSKMLELGKASSDGEALSYFTRYPAPDSTISSGTYLSTRSATEGWSVTGLDPQMTPLPAKSYFCMPGVAFSEDLHDYLLIAGGNLADAAGTSGECDEPVEELVAGEPRGYSNLYLHREGGPFELVNPVPNPAPPGFTPGNATFQAASADFSRIVFSEEAELTEDSPGGYNLFEWSDGTVHLIGVLPNGEPIPAILGAATEDWNEVAKGGSPLGLAPVSHAVSADGESVFFESNGNLYLRKNAGQPPAANANCRINGEPGLACTLQLDLTQWTGASGGGVFQFASRDGDTVFFTSEHVLTSSSKAAAGKPDLYEYDVQTNTLTDLSVGSSGPANVLGMSGGADDGSRIYFVAKGVLTPAQKNDNGEEAVLGHPNLYLAQHGKPLTYVATLGDQEPPGADWWLPGPNGGELTNQWSPSGRYLTFSSRKSLTEFDNTPAEPGDCFGEPTCTELYLFDAEADQVSCLSCDPLGAKSIASTRLLRRVEAARFALGTLFQPRIVSDTGQVFFEMGNPLSPRDVNGVMDVYEYRSGNLNLISSGTDRGGSAFVDASADRRDVFIVTPQPLVRSDTDGGLPSIYDARVGGGFSEPPPPPELCHGAESCRLGGSVPPSAAPPATGAFAGPGNPKGQVCKRGRVRRGGHCAKRKKAHHRHHRARKGRKG